MADTFCSYTRNFIFKSCFLLSEYGSIVMQACKFPSCVIDSWVHSWGFDMLYFHEWLWTSSFLVVRLTRGSSREDLTFQIFMTGHNLHLDRKFAMAKSKVAHGPDAGLSILLV